MKKIRVMIVAVALSLSSADAQTEAPSASQSKPDVRIPNETRMLMLEKVGQGKIPEVLADLAAESPYEEGDAKRFQFLGRNIAILTGIARSEGDKVNAFALAEQGASELKAWLKSNENALSKSEKTDAYGLMGHLYESRMKDERQAIPFYDLAVKQIAPEGWEFESVEQVKALRDSLTEDGKELGKAEAFALDRLIYLQHEQRIFSARIAAAAEIRQTRGSQE